jgi:hypothetical protein
MLYGLLALLIAGAAQSGSAEGIAASPATGAESTIIAYSVKVNTDGTFGECNLTPSTGSAARDREACRLLTTRLLKKPILDSSGHPAQSSVTGNLRWRIPHEDHASVK